MKIETESIGGAVYTIRSLADRQQFHDPNGEALALGISSSFWPLFGQIWPVGRVLARIMLEEPLKDRKILEIGCGIALPSIVIKKLRGDITACDYHPLTEQFLIENARLNSLSEIKYETGNWNTQNPHLGKFDLIIGSDVLYERHHVEILASFIDTHAEKNAEIIIVDAARGSHRHFAREMTKFGYSHSWTNLDDFSGEAPKVKGFVLRFKKI